MIVNHPQGLRDANEKLFALHFPDLMAETTVTRDMAVLRECYRVCAPGGHLVITVPAFMWLWSHNDDINAHVRRYTAGELRAKMEAAGFRIQRMTYNNFFVFPMAAAMLILRRGRDSQPELASHHLSEDEYQVEMEPASPLVNTVLEKVGIVEVGMPRLSE